MQKDELQQVARNVSTLAQSHQRDSIRSALVRRWIASHGITSNQLRRCDAVQQLVELDATDVSLPKTMTKLSLKQLEHSFETLMDAEHRKTHGAVYTPEWVVDHLIHGVIDHCESSKPTLCDPACGSGGFLLRAAAILNERFDIPFDRAFAEHLTGFDCDPQAIEHAKCLGELFLLSQGQTPSRDGFRLQVKDSLLDDMNADGFDLVVTNPPYVKLQNLPNDYRARLVEKYREFIKGSYSLALLFLVAGHRMLSESGQLGFVTQNNFFTSLAGEPLRRYLNEQRCVRRIVDFGHEHLFENASAYTCLVFLSRAVKDRIEFARPRTPRDIEGASGPGCAKNVGNSTLAEPVAHTVVFSEIPVDQLDAKKWRLAPAPHFENLRRIESTGVPLGNLADIRVGFATLRDTIFLVEDTGEHCLATSTSGESIEIERASTRAAVKIAKLNDEGDLLRNRTRIIFPYQRIAESFELIGESDFRRQFPQTFAHLMDHREALAARDKGKPNSEGWFAWGRSQGRESAGPKLLTKTFDRQPNFMLDPSDQLFCNGYSVSLPEDSRHEMTLDVLQCVLNSDILHYYAKLTSFQIEGGYQCYQKNFIEKFGIPAMDRDEAERLLTSTHDVRNEILAGIYQISRRDLDEVLR